MSYRGDVRLGTTVHLKFSTVNTSAVPTTLTSGTVSAYPDNSTTELTAGITLTADFDGRTGLHHVAVVATSGNGYLTATTYDLVLTAGTVGGTSVVGMVVGSFSIEARSAVMPTTAGRTLDVSAGGEAGLDWANVGSPTAANALTATTISTTQAVASVSGSVGSVTGSVNGNVVGSVGSVTAPVALTAAAVDAILDDPVEGAVTMRQSLRLMNAAAAGKLSGAATATITLRDLADTKDRIVATVDASGNRPAITRDLT